MDKLLGTLNQYLTAAQGLVNKYGPGVWDSTLELIRLNSIFNLAIAILATTAVTLALWKLLPYLIRRADSAGNNEEVPWIIGAVVCGIFALIGGIVLFVFWCESLVYWLGVFRPDLAMLYRIADKAGLL